ncbi:MAG: histidine kinase, partial [Methanoculleus sp. SDB]
QRIVQINDQCLKLLNRTKDDLIGLTMEEAALPVVSTREVLAIIEGLEKEQVITDLRYQSRGKDLFFRMQAIPTTFEDGEKGCTLVLEDVTERKRYIRDMEFLARTAMELVDLPPKADIYQYITEKIAELVPNPRCYVMSYDEVKMKFFMQAIFSRRFRDGVKECVGRDAVGMEFPFHEFVFSDPFFESPSSLRAMRELHFRPYMEDEVVSFYDYCMHRFSREACDEIVRRFRIGKLYMIGLVWKEQLFGFAGIFLSPDEVLEDQQAIESFLRQASIAIARRQTEDRLRRNEHRFKEVMDLSPYAAAFIDPDGSYLYLNHQFSAIFGYTLEDIPTSREWFQKAFPDEAARREAIATWQSDREQAGRGQPRSRTFSVRCKNGKEKVILFNPVELCDGTQYVTYEDVTEERRTYQLLVEEIAELRRQLASSKE